MNRRNPLLPDPRDPWPPEYWDQQAVDLWDSLPPKWKQQPFDSRDRWPTEYWDQQTSHPRDPWLFESWGQRSTYTRDTRPSKSRDRRPTDHRNPWFRKHRDQYLNSHKNSMSQECCQPAFDAIRRPSQIQHSSVSHEPRFQHVRRNNSAYHPYRRKSSNRQTDPPVAIRSHSKSSGDSSPKASARNRSNIIAVSVNTSTTKPASSTTSNIAEKKVSQKPKESLQVQVGNNDTTSEEVHYLYSVDPNEGKLVELVDLSENSQVSETQGVLVSESNKSYMPVNSNDVDSDLAVLKDSNCDDSINTFLNKGKSSTQNTSKVQGECGGAYCNICNKSYEELHNNKCDLYIARCGHLFCGLCIPRLKTKGNCIKCKNAISNLRKIFL